jgi:hypothetical protein
MERGERRHRIDASTAGDVGPKRIAGRRAASASRAPGRPAPLDDRSRTAEAASVVVLIPVYNDWESLAHLLPRLDKSLAEWDFAVDVLVVDDGSTTQPEDRLAPGPFRALRRLDVLHLRRNLGHQRAIAIGLAYIEDCLRARAVVVMDGDGEDDPADVPRLLDELERAGSARIVFAERTRRSESFGFRIFYALYKLLHHLLTGQKVRVGNFSAIPRRRLSSLVVVSELWNHYAAAVIRSRQPHYLLPTERAARLCGRSHMNFVSLVTHGLSAISVHSDVVGVRLLVVSAMLALLTAGAIVLAVIVRLTTNLAIPGWATTTVGLLLILLVQAVIAAFVFSFMILASRHGSPFLPRRDYSFFIGSVETIHGSEPSVMPLPVPEMVGEVQW